MVEENKELQEKAEQILKRMSEIMATAKGVDETKAFERTVDTTTKALVTKPNDSATKKTLVGFKTGTFLDNLYLNEQNQPLNGIPIVGSYGIVGLSGVGKSLLVQEILLRTASEGKGVVFITSEDIFKSDNERLDLQSRLIAKSKSLGLNWNQLKDHIFVLDCIEHSELREFSTLIGVYRSLVENPENNIKLLVVDSLSLLESYRANLKNRVLELSRYDQKRGITGFFVCQRSEEEVDKFAMAGNVGVAHNLDSVICIDIGKAMGQLKEDFGVKQWDMVHFCRILSCRLSGFNRKYTRMEISSDGFLRVKP